MKGNGNIVFFSLGIMFRAGGQDVSEKKIIQKTGIFRHHEGIIEGKIPGTPWQYRTEGFKGGLPITPIDAILSNSLAM